MSVQHIWNLFQLLGLFTGRKFASLSWDFVTERYKQHLETTTSHDVKGLAIGSFLEHIVVKRANDDLCWKNVKNAGLISAKPTNF